MIPDAKRFPVEITPPAAWVTLMLLSFFSPTVGDVGLPVSRLADLPDEASPACKSTGDITTGTGFPREGGGGQWEQVIRVSPSHQS